MSIVAFLQNQWFKDPVKVQQVYDRNPDLREELDARFLFMGCLTGKRLVAAFGDELCDQIIWANASPKIGGKSNSMFPPDPDHIRAVLAKHKPFAVLCFGGVAQQGVREAMRLFDAIGAWDRFDIIDAPHPAARQGTVPIQLKGAASQLRTMIAAHQAASDLRKFMEASHAD